MDHTSADSADKDGKQNATAEYCDQPREEQSKHRWLLLKSMPLLPQLLCSQTTFRIHHSYYRLLRSADQLLLDVQHGVESCQST
jgi:hypothetical protein